MFHPTKWETQLVFSGDRSTGDGTVPRVFGERWFVRKVPLRTGIGFLQGRSLILHMSPPMLCNLYWYQRRLESYETSLLKLPMMVSKPFIVNWSFVENMSTLSLCQGLYHYLSKRSATHAMGPQPFRSDAIFHQAPEHEPTHDRRIFQLDNSSWEEREY